MFRIFLRGRDIYQLSGEKSRCDIVFVNFGKKIWAHSLFEWNLEGGYLQQADSIAQAVIKNKSDDFVCAAADMRTTPAVRQNILREVNYS
jgi:hypothetical protein